MKNLIWLLIFGIVVVGLAQMAGGAMRRHDFEGKLHEIALQVTAKNHDEIKRLVVAEGGKLRFQVSPAEVNVQYAPTSDLGFAQRMVSRIGTFQNHRATIQVDYAQSILFFPMKRHAKGSALIESAAEAKRPAMPE